MSHEKDIAVIHLELTRWASDNGYSDMIDNLIDRINPQITVKMPESSLLYHGVITLSVGFYAKPSGSRERFNNIANQLRRTDLDFCNVIAADAQEYRIAGHDQWMSA